MAYVYLRQSTMGQVRHHQESTARQYALKDRALNLEKVGAVFALEASRLSRSCSDWHRMLEICALTGTLLVYGEEAGSVSIDPDQEVRSAVELIFELFRQTGSAYGVVRHFTQHQLRFPKRSYGGIWNHSPKT